MRAISLHEPWATLVAIGAKRFETRTWRPEYRGPLAIHASKKFTDSQRRLSSSVEFASPLLRAGILPSGGLVPTLGQVICVVDFAGAYETEYVFGHGGLVNPGSPEYKFGDYGPGRFVWDLRNVRRVKPFPWKGTQGFFFVPDELVAIQEAA